MAIMLVSLLVSTIPPAINASANLEDIVAEFRNPQTFNEESRIGSTPSGQENQEMPFEKMVIISDINYLYLLCVSFFSRFQKKNYNFILKLLVT